ncbi:MULTISPECIES: helix-turn-helix domain-containing protein [Oceanobacillus]|uniref:HTH-type transcriptional regulator Xre n=2 Tax=Oceanobacillus TaxID=182709 RepID=A0A0A1MMH2_9BACI|nr:helix-turn-helix transcriptional regulator [Oceanobacillus oncorhynchi]UUI39525.1 helix-turn-helix domain-containing protein [Oceanobacillus oncorhynchi]CEI80862.1 HTH-type transcriptional regulator Xre [Oceanobacillus oncorhynchi]
MDVFKERLIDLRVELGYKQENVAKELNLTTSAYGYYEQGKNEPSLETLYKIANFFQVSIDYLLGIIDTPQHPVYYPISNELTLNESELSAIQRMKELNLLEKVGENSKLNTERLNRCWEFIKTELAIDEK